MPSDEELARCRFPRPHASTRCLSRSPKERSTSARSPAASMPWALPTPPRRAWPVGPTLLVFVSFSMPGPGPGAPGRSGRAAGHPAVARSRGRLAAKTVARVQRVIGQRKVGFRSTRRRSTVSRSPPRRPSSSSGPVRSDALRRGHLLRSGQLRAGRRRREHRLRAALHPEDGAEVLARSADLSREMKG